MILRFLEVWGDIGLIPGVPERIARNVNWRDGR